MPKLPFDKAIRGWRAYWRHPFCLFVPFVILLAAVKENFPFTDYPMYSNPGPGPITYFYLTDSQDNPLPVQRHCGITSPRMKRLIEQRVKTHRREHPDVEDAERRGLIGDDVFVFLRSSADLRNRPLPAEPLRIYRGEIFQLPDRFKEDVELFAAENPATVPFLLIDESGDDAGDADFDGQPDAQEEAA